jgi:hypothetical protein
MLAGAMLPAKIIVAKSIGIICMQRQRQRKSGPRYTNGRLIPASRLDERALYSARCSYRWLRELAELGVPQSEGSNQRAGSVLGRLRLAGLISERQYWTGDEYGAIQHRHAAIMGYSLGIRDGRRPGGAALADPDPLVIARVKEQWWDCHKALERVNAESEVHSVCVFDRPQGSLPKLKQGLSVLQGVLDKY